MTIYLDIEILAIEGLSDCNAVNSGILV